MLEKTLQKIVSVLEKADEFYIPVKKLWKQLGSLGYAVPSYNEFLEFLKKDNRFEVCSFKESQFDDEKEMEEAGFFSGPRVKLRSREITKEDMQRITLKHAQNVIDNLVKAYEKKPKDFPVDKEDELIELMRTSKELKEQIEKAFKKKKD